MFIDVDIDENAKEAVAYVLLNGQPMDVVYSVDTEKGEVTVASRDARGNLMFVEDEVVKKTLAGKVEVIFEPGWYYDNETGFLEYDPSPEDLQKQKARN